MAVVESERLLVDVDDAARIMGISRRKLLYLVSAGEIPVVRVGRAVRVPLEGLRQFVDRLQSEQRIEREPVSH